LSRIDQLKTIVEWKRQPYDEDVIKERISWNHAVVAVTLINLNQVKPAAKRKTGSLDYLTNQGAEKS
jgi:hypothetical protein